MPADRYRAGDPGCQADNDNRRAGFDADLAKTLVNNVLCPCGNTITATLLDVAAQPGAVVRAPSRCSACRGE